MKNSKSKYSYKELGEYINRLRSQLGINIRTLCADCHISTHTYYEVRLGLTPTSAITPAYSTIYMSSS